jgi:tRNA threonylcarbamoyladenosine biosynthesis protein TsaE
VTTPTATRTVFSLSEQETLDLGRRTGQKLRAGDLLVLEGELGTGKTVFVRGVAEGLGLPPDDVTSPSFTLVHEHRGGRIPLFHVDLYRVDSAEELMTIGLDEILSSGAVVAVEWGERLPPVYRRNAVTVRLHDAGDGARRIEVASRRDRARRPAGDA